MRLEREEEEENSRRGDSRTIRGRWNSRSWCRNTMRKGSAGKAMMTSLILVWLHLTRTVPANVGHVVSVPSVGRFWIFLEGLKNLNFFSLPHIYIQQLQWECISVVTMHRLIYLGYIWIYCMFIMSVYGQSHDHMYWGTTCVEGVCSNVNRASGIALTSSRWLEFYR